MGKETAARDFREGDWSGLDDALVLAERRPTHRWSRICTRWIVVKGHQRFEYTVSVRSNSAEELSSLRADSGFVNVKVHGNLDGRDYDHEAERLVVVGEK